ncbi:ABC-type transport auxiliary lipoprotein family protein [Thiobaca trueperi]|uniref:Cholesterol transport system auxiliary component n=1 Tax=Thiobaca trueperi TaxID=127458 RepID=A0A4R3MV52_9GAMM|nr:ABC-type transport auxiliary lipoprotein family protein [Thiobaca trueperi]TCT20204.1 cholesterol transport system auxiliary component [Thiobaca trueperi]
MHCSGNYLTALLLVLLLTGCGSSPPLQSDRYYALSPIIRETPAATPASGVLLVNTLAARGFLGGRQIVYRQDGQPLRVERYDWLLWEETVPRALAQSLADAIRDAGLFEFVVTPADRARADYILSGEVETFEHRPTDQPPRVVASLNLSLVRATDRRSVWMKTYRGEEQVDASTPEAIPDAMAESFNRLTARLVGEVVRDLRGNRQD